MSVFCAKERNKAAKGKWKSQSPNYWKQPLATTGWVVYLTHSCTTSCPSFLPTPLSLQWAFFLVGILISGRISRFSTSTTTIPTSMILNPKCWKPFPMLSTTSSFAENRATFWRFFSASLTTVYTPDLSTLGSALQLDPI